MSARESLSRRTTPYDSVTPCVRGVTGPQTTPWRPSLGLLRPSSSGGQTGDNGGMSAPALVRSELPAGPGRVAPSIRSFKHRRGRITVGQRDALGTLWPRYGLALGPHPIDLAAVFGRVAPVVLEIGFGLGETSVELSLAVPDRVLIAVDVHTP